MPQHLKTGNTGIARKAHIFKTNNTTSPVSQYSMGYVICFASPCMVTGNT